MCNPNLGSEYNRLISLLYVNENDLWTPRGGLQICHVKAEFHQVQPESYV